VSSAIGDKWLVDDGLRAGDKVIVEGLQKIRPGVAVRVVEAGSAAPTPTAAPARAARHPRRRRGRKSRHGQAVADPAMARFFIDRPVFAW